jgi:hypothetical protein
MDEVPSASQIKKDARALYGALLSACQGGVRRRILMENRGKQDGIRSWYQLVNQYETDGNNNIRIKKLESIIPTVFHQHYKGGLFKWIHNYEDAFTELVILGQVTWNDDNIKKRRLVQNSQNIGMADTVFEALVDDKSFLETCNFRRSHAISAICGLQRIKGNILVRFEPTNLRIVYRNNYLRNMKYVYLNSWVRQ